MKVCSVCQRCYDDSVLSCTEENHEFLVEVRAGDCEIVQNYRLETLHEATPAGEIYRAVNTILKKPYFIKIVPREAFDEAGRRQFLNEAQALASIIHPNLVRVFESGTLADGSLYVVTEYFSAQNLRECLENVGSPSEVTALTITRQAAEALEALHSVDVLHRSVRPENVILTSDAENRFLIKLQNIDFGSIHQKYVIGNAEQNIGDLRYFSPEQCTMGEVDAQTDVYSLGVVLYETLAGHVPFDSPYADALIKKQISEPPPEIKIKSFDIRMLLTHTLTDALQKQSRTRLKSANAFARRIRHIEQLATHSSTPPPAVAYPASMNKSEVVFAPPAKVEKIRLPIPKKAEQPIPAKIETKIENPVIAETIVENPAPPEIIESVPVVGLQSIIENLPAVKNPIVEMRAIIENAPAKEETEIPLSAKAEAIPEMPLEIPAVLESQSTAEELPSEENPAVIEETVEASPVVEYLVEAEPETLIEETAAIDDPVVMESLPAVEAVFADSVLVEEESSIEDLPLVEAHASFENIVPVEIEPETAVEEPVLVENQAAFEDSLLVEARPADSVPVEAAPVVEIEPQIEEIAVAESQPEVENIVPVEAQTPSEQPVLAENVEEAAIPFETQTTESERPFVTGYTTTKLPPVEEIIGKRPPENIVITDITPIFSMKKKLLDVDKASDIHKTSEPAKLDWEQPDDIPTITQALDVAKKDGADTEFSPKADFIDDEDEYIIDAGDADSPVNSEEAETYRPITTGRPVFSYDDSGTSWNLPDKRKILTGAGLLAVFALAVSATFLSRQFWTARAGQQTTAQTSSSEKTLPKAVEPVKVSDASQPTATKPEDLSASKPDDSEIPELPNYQPRETDTKTALQASTETRGKKRVLKEAVDKLDQTVQTKNAPKESPVFDKRGNPKSSSDNKSTVKKQGSTPGRTEIFTRPRIVKTP